MVGSCVGRWGRSKMAVALILVAAEPVCLLVWALQPLRAQCFEHVQHLNCA